MLLVAFNDIGVLQTHLFARCQTLELLLSHLHEVVALNPELTTESDGMCAVSLVFGVVDGYQFLGFPLRIVGEHQFNRIKNCTDTTSFLVEVFADGGFQQCEVVQSVKLCVSDGIDEVADAL